MQNLVLMNREDLEKILTSSAEKITEIVLEKLSEQDSSIPKSVLTTRQLADYLQVSTQSILNWVRRDKDKNPLPVKYAGADPRFDLEEVKEWSKREADLKLSNHKR